MIKMAIFDIDGTIYNSENKSVSERVIYAMKQLREKGVLVTIATGRTYHKIDQVLKDCYDYIVAANGHVLLDNQKNILTKHELTEEETIDIIDFCEQHQLPLLLKYDDACYLNQYAEGFHWFDGEADLFEDLIILPSLHQKEGTPHAAFMQIADQELKIFQEKNPGLRLVDIGGDCYDIYYGSLNKSITLNQLLSNLGVSWEECFAIGDGKNDIEMIQCAGLGIAMDNGADELKAIAKDTTKSSAEDGVYWALKKYQLID